MVIIIIHFLSSHDLVVDVSLILEYRAKELVRVHTKLCLGILMILQLLSLSPTIFNKWQHMALNKKRTTCKNKDTEQKSPLPLSDTIHRWFHGFRRLEQSRWVTSPVLHVHKHLPPCFLAISGQNISTCLLTLSKKTHAFRSHISQHHTPTWWGTLRPLRGGPAAQPASVPCPTQPRWPSSAATCPPCQAHGSRPDASNTLPERGAGSGPAFSHPSPEGA